MSIGIFIWFSLPYESLYRTSENITLSKVMNGSLNEFRKSQDVCSDCVRWPIQVIKGT